MLKTLFLQFVELPGTVFENLYKPDFMHLAYYRYTNTLNGVSMTVVSNIFVHSELFERMVDGNECEVLSIEFHKATTPKKGV